MPIISGSGSVGGAVSGVTVTGTAASGEVPIASSSSAGAWAYPPGFELYYSQGTSPVSVVSTTEGTPTAILAGASATYENVAYLFHFFCPQVNSPTPTGGTVTALLLQDGTSLGRIGLIVTDITGGSGTYIPMSCFLRYTPTAGAHTFSVSAFVSSTVGTPAFSPGLGGAGAYVPMFIRATKC